MFRKGTRLCDSSAGVSSITAGIQHHILHAHVGTVGLDNIITKVDEELGQATLSSSIVSQDRGESGIAEGFGQALSESLAGSGIVAQSSLKRQ